LSVDRVDRVPEPDEQRLEVILARRGQLASVDANVLDRELPALDQTGHIPSERAGVLRQLLRGLLKAREHPGLAVFGDPVHEELKREQTLAGTRAAAHQRNPAAGKPATSDLVEPHDPNRTLAKGLC